MSVSIKRNFAYKTLLTISNYLMGLITFPYVSRVLGVENLGLVSFVDNTINYFLLFATLGVGILGVREIASVKNDSERFAQIFSNILGMNLLFTFCTLLIYFLCIFLIPQLHHYQELFYIGAAKILFTAFLVEWFFTGTENFRYITVRSIGIRTVYVVLVFVLVRIPEDYKLYFILTIGVVVLNALINMIYARRFVKITARHLFKLRYVKQNLMLGIYSIMTSMYLTFNVMFLGMVSNNTEVGYYTTAFKLYSILLGFFTAFTNVMLPRMSALLAEGEKERFQQLIDKSFSAVCTFSVPIILCSIVLAPDIIYILSGPGYEGAILPMRIIMPAMLFVGIAQILAVQILMPMKKDKILLYASVLGAVIALMLNIIAVTHWHSVGSAIVLICSEMVVTVSYMFYSYRHHIVHFPLDEFVKSFLCSLPIMLVCIICSLWISNPYFSVLMSLLLSGIIWVCIEWNILGGFLKNLLKRD